MDAGGVMAKALKVSALGLVLTLVVCVNSILISKMKKKARKRIAGNITVVRIILLLSGLNIVTGFINIGSFILSTIKGGWFFGYALCQVLGCVGGLLVAGNIFVLMVVAVERYTRVLVSTEYQSLFTSTNLKIMIAGAFILVTPVSFAPIYGFGEYTFLRGKFQMSVSITNISMEDDVLVPMPVAHAPSAYYTRFLNLVDNRDAQSILDNTADYLHAVKNIEIRNVEPPSPAGLSFTLGARNEDSLMTFIKEHKTGVLNGHLEKLLNGNETLTIINVRRFSFNTSISDVEVEEYKNIYLPFQDDSQCSLDYTYVNKNIKSYLVLHTVWTLALPFLVTLFCYMRLACTQQTPSRPLPPAPDITVDDTLITRMFATTTFITMMCHIPFIVTNAVFGAGIYLHPGILFFVTVVKHFSHAVLGLVYGIVTTDCFSRFKACCCKCPAFQRADGSSVFEVPHVMLLRRSSSTVESARRRVSESSA